MWPTWLRRHVHSSQEHSIWSVWRNALGHLSGSNEIRGGRVFQLPQEPLLFRDTILKLIASSNLEYKNLTAKAEDAA
jgi:hypothetical protein